MPKTPSAQPPQSVGHADEVGKMEVRDGDDGDDDDDDDDDASAMSTLPTMGPIWGSGLPTMGPIWGSGNVVTSETRETYSAT